MKKKIDFKDVANKLVFSYPQFVKMFKSGDLRLRKGKTLDDVANAMHKAKKNGMQKIEYELSMLELYLKDVFLSTSAHHSTQHDICEQDIQQQDSDDKIDQTDNNILE